MSIIQEALKKAGGGMKGAQPELPSVAQGLAEEAHQPSGPKTRQSDVTKKAPGARHDPKAVAMLLLLLAVTVFLTAGELFNKKGAAVKPPAPAVVTPTAQKLPDLTAVQEASYRPVLPSIVFQKQEEKGKEKEKLPPAPEFTLNGIMYLEEGPRAIVNDAMVELGDTVNGATVVKIDRRSVMLRRDDGEVTLNLK